MKQTITEDQAGTLALRALAWLAATQKLEGFLVTSGLSPSELRSRAEEPAFLAGVLMYILSNDAMTIEFCDAESIPPLDLHLASRALGVVL